MKTVSNRVEKVTGVKFQGKEKWQVQDALTVEKLLQIKINGNPFSMTMRTPGHDKELTRGLLHAEQATGQLKTFRYLVDCIDSDGDVQSVNVLLDPHEKGKGIEKKRSLVSSSSCGICGMEDAEAIQIEGESLITTSLLSKDKVEAYYEKMAEAQRVFQDSGGSHAAALFSHTGDMLSVFEDIGRHNAVDKCIGNALLHNNLDQAEVLLVSGRVSFEIIQKAYNAQIPFLAAISAPSSMAVALAKEKGITLMAFCRSDKMTVYSHADRIGE